MSEFSEDLRSIMAGEFSLPFQVLKNGVEVYDSDDHEAGCIFDRTFVMVGDDGVEVQSKHSRIQCHIEDVEEEVGEELGEEFSIVVDGSEFPVKHVERYGHGLGVVELKKPI